MSNRSLISSWHRPVEDEEKFRGLLRVGDRIEFDRGVVYKHWAVFVGDDRVVHRHVEGKASSGKFASRGDWDIRVDEISTIWHKSPVRINNQLDVMQSPYDPKNIREFAEKAVKCVETRELLGTYDLDSNNCEHFASWARNGRYTSKQVDKVTFRVVLLGIITIFAFFLEYSAAILNLPSIMLSSLPYFVSLLLAALLFHIIKYLSRQKNIALLEQKRKEYILEEERRLEEEKRKAERKTEERKKDALALGLLATTWFSVPFLPLAFTVSVPATIAVSAGVIAKRYLSNRSASKAEHLK